MGTAAGGAYATIEDLFQFSQALYRGALLPPQLSKQVLSMHQARPTNQDFHYKAFTIGEISAQENMGPYGFAGVWNPFGFALWHKPDLIGHTGGTKGASALLAMSPDNRYTIVVLSNLDNGTGPLYKKIREILGFDERIENF